VFDEMPVLLDKFIAVSFNICSWFPWLLPFSVVAHLHSGISKTSITRSFERELASALKRFFQPEVLGDRC